MIILLVQLPAAPPPIRRQRPHRRRRMLFLSVSEPADDAHALQSAAGETSAPAPPSRRPRISFLILALLFIVYLAGIHPWFMNWGATEDEQSMSLPGDRALDIGRHRFTRAISIDAPPSTVWPWIAQMGQERAGFYSNTWLENMFGLNIHTPDGINPIWQQHQVGDLVFLGPRDFLGGQLSQFTETRVVGMEAGHWIAYPPFHFVLHQVGKNGTRLLIRESLPASRFDRLLNALFLDPFHFIMEARMLRGIKEHAERVQLVRWQLRITARVGWVLCTLMVLFAFVREPDRLPFLLLPLLWAVLVVAFTGDWDAAMAAFLTAGIPAAAMMEWGRKSWVPLLFIAAFAMLILIVAPEPFCFLGITLGAATVLKSLVVF
jgi:hypothetical protein